MLANHIVTGLKVLFVAWIGYCVWTFSSAVVMVLKGLM